MIAAAGAVAIEVGPLHALLDQVSAGGAVRRDTARRRDVIGGDRVADDDERARPDDVGERRRLRVDAFEEGGLAHVGRLRIPAVDRTGGRRHLLPVLIAVEDPLVLASEHLDLERLANCLVDLLRRGPQLVQPHRFAVPVGADRLAREVAPDITGQRVGHHQRR